MCIFNPYYSGGNIMFLFQNITYEPIITHDKKKILELFYCGYLQIVQLN